MRTGDSVAMLLSFSGMLMIIIAAVLTGSLSQATTFFAVAGVGFVLVAIVVYCAGKDLESQENDV